MPWKNGRGSTTQIYIDPAGSSLEKNNFSLRLSSAPINEETEFSVFPGMQRFLVPIKGRGFEINANIYEKYEVAHFSGNKKIQCHLLEGPIVDFGIIYDPQNVDIQVRILNLKSKFVFQLEENSRYFLTVLFGALQYTGNLEGTDKMQLLTELETLVYENEKHCEIFTSSRLAPIGARSAT